MSEQQREAFVQKEVTMKELTSRKIGRKVVLIVLDSAGIGALPDADQYGDSGANTVGRIGAAMPQLELPYLNAMGLDRLVPAFAGRKKASVPWPCHALKMAEQSRGKDTITGHWELAGVITQEPFPTYPQGFPEALVKAMEIETGYDFIGNEVASGTEIIARLGARHMETGCPILYTSADSVLQIAAHESVIPATELHRICEVVRNMTMHSKHRVGRVIARPFIGSPGAFLRTANRHDYALETPTPNLLQQLTEQHQQLFGVGKIPDIFPGTRFTKAIRTKGNMDGMDKLNKLYEQLGEGLLFVNLVDFDMIFGHRRDIRGYGNALAAFDYRLGQLLPKLDFSTLLVITADHGCDPGYSGTDHTREYVPVLMTGAMLRGTQEQSVMTRSSFADLAATIADYLGISYTGAGQSFCDTILG